MSAIHSPDLQWQVIRTYNSFLVKRDGIIFSAEPNNVANKHSFKFSGLANNNTVAVNNQSFKTKDGKTAQRIVLTTRRTGFGSNHKVSGGNIHTVLARNKRAHRSYGARVIEANTSRGFYRRDLAKFAIGRYHALNRAAGLKKTVKKQTRRQAAKAAKAKDAAAKTTKAS